MGEPLERFVPSLKGTRNHLSCFRGLPSPATVCCVPSGLAKCRRRPIQSRRDGRICSRARKCPDTYGQGESRRDGTDWRKAQPYTEQHGLPNQESVVQKYVA